MLKGVILAGGTGTRLYPLTKVINKHLLPVGRYPMIFYSILKLKQAGVEDILIVTGKQSAGLYLELLGSGKEWNVNLTFRIQEQAGGIAQALGMAEGFIQPDEKFIVLLGDNLFEDSLQDAIHKFKQQDSGAKVMLKRVNDPRRYGVPIMEDNIITGIEEKPGKPKSPFCVTGIYMYHGDVFQIAKQLSPSQRGEYEITDVNNAYASNGKLSHDILLGWWTDAGTHEALQEAGIRLSRNQRKIRSTSPYLKP